LKQDVVIEVNVGINRCGMEPGKPTLEFAEHLMKLRGLNLSGLLGYEGPFFGLSGLILGMAKLRGVEGLALFGLTTPMPENPEFPDPVAAKTLLTKVSEILNLPLDLSGLEPLAEKDERVRPREPGFSV